MKTLLLKLIPGAAATLAAFVLAAFAVHAQQTPAAVPVQAQGVTPGAPQVIVCGVCGARITAPQPVLVAAPYCQDAGQGAYYGAIPAAPVFGLTDYWRADPRLIVPVCQVPRPVVIHRRLLRP